MSSKISVPILETDRLILRGHRVEDFDESAAMWADPVVVRHIGGTPSSREQSWSRLLHYGGHWLHLGFGYWVVAAKSDGRFLGEIGLADYRRDTSPSMSGMPEAGWVLKTDAHGQGYATEAVTRMLEWADTSLEAAKTVCMIDPAYAPSINVARKSGYAHEVVGRYGDRPALFMERARKRARRS